MKKLFMIIALTISSMFLFGCPGSATSQIVVPLDVNLVLKNTSAEILNSEDFNNLVIKQFELDNKNENILHAKNASAEEKQNSYIKLRFILAIAEDDKQVEQIEKDFIKIASKKQFSFSINDTSNKYATYEMSPLKEGYKILKNNETEVLQISYEVLLNEK